MWRAMFNKLDFNKKFFLSCLADNIVHESDRQENKVNSTPALQRMNQQNAEYKNSHHKNTLFKFSRY